MPSALPPAGRASRRPQSRPIRAAPENRAGSTAIPARLSLSGARLGLLLNAPLLQFSLVDRGLALGYRCHRDSSLPPERVAMHKTACFNQYLRTLAKILPRRPASRQSRTPRCARVRMHGPGGADARLDGARFSADRADRRSRAAGGGGAIEGCVSTGAGETGWVSTEDETGHARPKSLRAGGTWESGRGPGGNPAVATPLSARVRHPLEYALSIAGARKVSSMT